MAVTKSKKKKIRQKNLELHRNQMRLNRVLEVLGVTDIHKTLHADFRENILKNPDPQIALECPEDGPEYERIRKRLGEWKAISYKGISASDFTEVMFPLVRYISSAVGRELMAEYTDNGFKEVPKDLFLSYMLPAREFLHYFLDQLSAVMQLTVWEETAPDRQYVRMELDTEDLSRDRLRFKINANVEKIKRAWLCGGWKYHVGTYYDTFFTSNTEVRWLSKCPLDYGLPGEANESLPVYISGHALDRIRERLDDKWVGMMAMFSIYFSLDKPICCPLPDASGDMLIELWVKDPEMKLGYFVASRVRNEIIIKTFLFITMYQTPEGYKLYRRLRMARPDYDFHRLENYSTLARSDITTHPTLRPIWIDCGFKGLLTVIDRGVNLLGVKQKEQANELIRYFRLERV
jgi:hypothetical protein